MPADWPAGPLAAGCIDAEATYCIAAATVTPVGGAPTALSELGLTPSAAIEPDDYTAWLRWAVDGWTGQSTAVADGEVTLVLRTGAFVPRMTVAVTTDLRVARSVDETGNHTLTLTGRAAHVDWATGEAAADCAAGHYCGDYDTTADEAGTGRRFEGRTQDLEGNSQEYVDAWDGAYLATDAQARTESLRYDTDGEDAYLALAVLGNPHLDVEGNPVRNSLSVWLPPGYFTAAGTSPDAAVMTGVDVVGTADGMSASLPVTASPQDGGVRLDVPDVGTGAALGEITMHHRPSGAEPGATAPAMPRKVAVTGEPEGVRVAWQAPASDGAAPIVGYRARAFSAATGGVVVSRCDADTDVPACVIPGLTDGEIYHVAVAAVSARGEGRPAVRVPAAAGEPVPVPPSAPLAVRVLPGPNRLSVTWTAPASDGGAPVGSYLARAYRTAAGGTPFASCAATGTGRSCVLTGLTGGARVYVGVIARNPAAPGRNPWCARRRPRGPSPDLRGAYGPRRPAAGSR